MRTKGKVVRGGSGVRPLIEGSKIRAQHQLLRYIPAKVIVSDNTWSA